MTAIRHITQQRLERVDGAASAVFAYREGRTCIADLYQRAPCRVLFPKSDPGDPVAAALLTTSGGLTGGDRLTVRIAIQESAATTITTQAAEKIYRSMGEVCSIGIALDVGPAAWTEWLMQETILFDGARLSRRIDADIAPAGRLLAVESLVFGRAAMGEIVRQGHVHDIWRIRLGGRLAWIDALKLDGDVAAERAMPFGFGSAAGYATLVYAGPDAARWLDAARAAVATSGAAGAATSFDGLLVARLWAEDALVLRKAVAHSIVQLRNQIAGLPARMPRLWSV